jgi:hypothetical protein
MATMRSKSNLQDIAAFDQSTESLQPWLHTPCETVLRQVESDRLHGVAVEKAAEVDESRCHSALASSEGCLV